MNTEEVVQLRADDLFGSDTSAEEETPSTAATVRLRPPVHPEAAERDTVRLTPLVIPVAPPPCTGIRDPIDASDASAFDGSSFDGSSFDGSSSDGSSSKLKMTPRHRGKAKIKGKTIVIAIAEEHSEDPSAELSPVDVLLGKDPNNPRRFDGRTELTREVQ
jgi:hypothetical protein